jgi:hypothetical protein
VSKIGVNPIFIEIQGQRKLCHPDGFNIQIGIDGIRCDFDDEIDSCAQKIEMSHWPVQLYFFEGKTQYIKLGSRLIKKLPVPFSILVRKIVRLELAARV